MRTVQSKYIHRQQPNCLLLTMEVHKHEHKIIKRIVQELAQQFFILILISFNKKKLINIFTLNILPEINSYDCYQS